MSHANQITDSSLDHATVLLLIASVSVFVQSCTRHCDAVVDCKPAIGSLRAGKHALTILVNQIN